MAAATKKKRKEAYPWKAGTSSGHITNLKQSILETFDIYEFNPLILGWEYLSQSKTIAYFSKVQMKPRKALLSRERI
jgi:hypothetical protein